jgi:sulfonate transport system substrate-binding protein
MKQILHTLSRIAVLASATIFAMAGLASAETNTVRFSYRLTTTSIAMTKGGFAERYGLKIEPVQFTTGIEANEGLITGTIDVGLIGITPTSTILTKTDKVIAIGVSDFGGGRYKAVVRKDSPYHDMKDLLGRKIAIKVGSGNYAAFLIYINSQGWKESDFGIFNAGDTEAIAALEEGSVDAVVYWEPIVSILIAKGVARPIFSFKGVVQNPVFLIANREFATKNPHTMAKFIAAFMDAQDYLTHDVPKAAKLIASTLAEAGQKTDPKIYELSLPAVTYDVHMTPPLVQDLKDNWQLLSRKGKLKGAEPNWSHDIDHSYIQMAEKIRKPM